MRNTKILRLLMATALLVLAIPVVTSAQFYRDRYYNRDYNRDQYDRTDTREMRNALARLDNSSARLEDDLRFTPGRRVLGIFQFRTIDMSAIAQVRDFRGAVRQLRINSDNGRALNNTFEEAQIVLNRGVQLDRYLRLRSGSTRVDADLSDIRSSLHIIADAYGLEMPY